ncbi:MAG: glucuronyl hydrolase [Flavobacteriales bacterium]|nr:glucuronyl hydrolase [Flavobacteriales bacterium]NCP51516.1 glucuronyl hydrolase [Flavobacteriales bacterium]NCP59881.1 glucuronyl hydrolase [Flavobacteriales bacterium]PIV94807.1 MAG: glucuronyl hydrolase [Flavobacteriaceae bacterium CG17_big_fil_post_rev_8_21_14_2_50_33_15]
MLVFILVFIYACKSDQSNDSAKRDVNNNINNKVEKASRNLKDLAKNLNQESDFLKFPRSLNKSGNIKLVNTSDWTSGFYPGVLWLMHDLTKDSYWKNNAVIFTNALEIEQNNSLDHDIGFKMMSSFGLGYKYTKDPHYRDVLIHSAKTLVTRFNPNVGCIRSWDHHKDKWEFPVIIDNLMNLELLFWAWKETGDEDFYNVASTHAKTTLKNHFREDYSSYHVVNYDTVSGAAIHKATHQGFSDNSSWARGEAWALYGYTMAYRETSDIQFLIQAEAIANYIINIALLPQDLVPLWDFSLNSAEGEPKDASAAAIMASALFELSTMTKTNSKEYLNVANGIIESLSSDNYFNIQGENKGFLLKHSTGSKPKNLEVDVPLIYADYYFLEALSRQIKITTNKTIAL